MDVKHSPYKIDLKHRRRNDDEAQHYRPQLYISVVVSDGIPVIQQVTTTNRRHLQHLLCVLTHSAKHLLNQQTTFIHYVHIMYMYNVPKKGNDNLMKAHPLSGSIGQQGLNIILLFRWNAE